MAVKIGSLIIRLAVEHGLLQEGLSKAERDVKKTAKSIEKTGRSLVDFGQKMAVAVSLPIAALAKGAVDGFVEQKKAMADVTAALASMGNASGKTAGELAKTADQLEMRSLNDAEVILKQVTAQLLTFGRISGQEFDRAQQATLDLAQRMDGDLKGAAIQIGKALNDPVKGLTALSKAGIQFSADQKAVIKNLVETGQVAAAQRIILQELETQFKGSAAAAADATPWRQAQVAIGQAMDAIGEILLPIVTEVAGAIQRMAQEFSKLSPEMKNVILIIAGIAAAAGPVLIVLGTLIQSTAGITAAFLTLSGAGTTMIVALRTVALAATGLGAVVLALGLNFQQTTTLVAGAAAGYLTYRGALLLVSATQRIWAAVVVATEAALWAMVRGVAGATSAKVALSGVVATLTGGVRALTASLITNPFTAVAAAVGVLAGAMVTLGLSQQQARAETDKLINSLKQLGAARDADFRKQRGLVEGQLQMELGTKPNEGFMASLLPDWAKAAASADRTARITQLRKVLKDADQAYADAGKAASNASAPIVQSGVAAEGAGKKLKSLADGNKAAAEEFQRLYDRLFPFQAATREFAREMESIQKSRLSDAEKEEMISRLERETYRNRTQGLGKAKVSDQLLSAGPLYEAEKVARYAEEVGKQLVGMNGKVRVQTVQIAESFKDMADKSIQALDRMMNAFKGGSFLDILGSVLSFGLQLGGMGAFGKTIQNNINAPVRAAANGTSFHPGGLLKVGERGPEILQVPRGGRVVPNHELREAGQSAIRIILDERTDIVEARIGRTVAGAAPAIMEGSAQVTTSRMARSHSRRIG